MRGLSSERRPVARRRRSIDWCRISSPSSSSENEARNSNSWCPALIGLKAGEGFLDGRVVGEDPIQGGELEHDASLLVGSGQAQLALAAADLLQRRDHGAEAGRVDKANALHVDDDPRRPFLTTSEIASLSAGAPATSSRPVGATTVIPLSAVRVSTSSAIDGRAYGRK